MKAVIYRHNPALALLVQKANPDFVHEFPAGMPIEQIRQELPRVTKSFWEGFRACPGDWQVHVDRTVLSAAGEYPFGDFLPRLIRQDDVVAYDAYAAHVAEKAKRAAREGQKPRVTIVRDRIADHNSEAPQRRDGNDGLCRLEADLACVRKWVERLEKLGIAPEVVEARDFERSVQFGHTNLNNAVVVCDHHNGDLPEFIQGRGGVWFEPYAPYEDDDFLAS
jgi:hypothetical protein